MKESNDLHTAAGFLTERRDFLHIYATKSTSGEGYDVVMRIDGTYFDKEMAEACAEGMKEIFDSIRDIPKDKRIWWSGPPWATTAVRK